MKLTCRKCGMAYYNERDAVLHQCSPFKDAGKLIPPLKGDPEPKQTPSLWARLWWHVRRVRWFLWYWKSGDPPKLSWWLAGTMTGYIR